VRSRRYGPTAPAPEPLEGAIQSSIRKALDLIGYSVSSTSQTRASRQTVGMPDLFVAHAAWRVFAWIEVKRPGERRKPHQRAWAEPVEAAGCPVLVATSAAEAIEKLNELRTLRREG
jgi:hypothetical protein